MYIYIYIYIYIHVYINIVNNGLNDLQIVRHNMNTYLLTYLEALQSYNSK